MDTLERLQVMTEIVREFKTAILNDAEPDRIGQAVLDVIQEAGDSDLANMVLQAFLKRSNREIAVNYLDQATRYLHEKIDDYL